MEAEFEKVLYVGGPKDGEESHVEKGAQSVIRNVLPAAGQENTVGPYSWFRYEYTRMDGKSPGGLPMFEFKGDIDLRDKP